MRSSPIKLLKLIKEFPISEQYVFYLKNIFLIKPDIKVIKFQEIERHPNK